MTIFPNETALLTNFNRNLFVDPWKEETKENDEFVAFVCLSNYFDHNERSFKH